MSNTNPLSLVGNFLEEAHKAYEQLPNQYTKGELEGIRKVYQSILQSMDPGSPNPYTDITEEEIPFSRSPINPVTGQMRKYGNGVGVSDVEEVQRSMSRFPAPSMPTVHELKEIRYRIENIYDLIKPFFFNQVPTAFTEETTKDSWEYVSPERQKEIQLEILDETAQDSQEAGLYDDDDRRNFVNRPWDNVIARSKEWDTSFGDRMRGISRTEEQPIEDDVKDGMGGFTPLTTPEDVEDWKHAFHETPQEEDYYDPETGTVGKQRVIGERFNPDEDTQEKKTVEEWDRGEGPDGLEKNLPNVYTDTQDFGDELQTLGPGE